MKRQRQKRQGHTFSRIFAGVLIAVASIIGLVVIFIPKETKAHRWTVAVIGSPVTIVSWDRVDGDVTVLTVPSDLVTEGAYGYGRYSIEALWRLGLIDRVHGGLLVQESLSDMLGVPISWYIGPRGEDLPAGSDDPVTSVRSALSLQQMARQSLGARHTNMPIANYIAMSWAITTARPDKFDVYQLTAHSIGAAEPLPDGTTQYIVDRERFDHVMGDAFEDERVRREALPVAVLNTTNVAALGNRAARMLTHLGVNVTMVANDEVEADQCLIHGSKSALSSYSSLLIQRVLRCRTEEVKEEYPVDLVVRIGTRYQQTFISK